MKITIIAPNSFGYIDFLVSALKSKSNVEVTHINFSNFNYKYHSKAEKIKNAFTKLFFNKNIKESYKSQCILEQFSENEKQDIIIVIRPDKIELKTLLALKLFTNNFYAFYFDSISNFPKKIGLIPVFDKVFSYEKDDVKKYNLEFITNYIYDFEPKSKKHVTHKIFNVSSFDERFETLNTIATYLKHKNISYNFIVRKEKSIETNLITITPEYLLLNDVKKLILSSEILLDIQKDNQKGLSFRVFEALGYDKKLITTNTDVVTYPFFNANNILVIDANNIIIPESFLNSGYEKISNDVLYPFTLSGWIRQVFAI